MKKNKKPNAGKIIGIIICVVVVGAFLYSTCISDKFTMDDAIAIAESYAPDNTQMVETEEDRKAYDITFASEDSSRLYEFEVNKARHGISKIELSTTEDNGGRVINISSEQAKSIIEDRFNHLKSIQSFLTQDDGFHIYQIAFKSGKFYGEAEINPENGHIMEMTIEYLKKATPSDGDFNFEKAFVDDNIDVSQTGPSKPNSADSNSANSNLESPNSTNSNSASPNQQPDKNSQNGSTGKKEITMEDAKALVLDKLPGSRVVDIEYDVEYGYHVYEGEAFKDGYEYDFEINAKTGEFIHWHKEIAD